MSAGLARRAAGVGDGARIGPFGGVAGAADVAPLPPAVWVRQVFVLRERPVVSGDVEHARAGLARAMAAPVGLVELRALVADVCWLVASAQRRGDGMAASRLSAFVVLLQAEEEAATVVEALRALEDAR